jgi:hypothetical protein
MLRVEYFLTISNEKNRIRPAINIQFVIEIVGHLFAQLPVNTVFKWDLLRSGAVLPQSFPISLRFGRNPGLDTAIQTRGFLP